MQRAEPHLLYGFMSSRSLWINVPSNTRIKGYYMMIFLDEET
ncbi:hypothetical protein M8C21_007308 [Ambrosia artemisiifolia]|uniref:Uncharacterized protein n=1 Tax=Ambrosia artemisiifolia TaxID=4212 RepID=A0AAD5GK66_AMBAR|nr:hypothetical protein M8C21_007308 [Ambrosia artemisiifolia]